MIENDLENGTLQTRVMTCNNNITITGLDTGTIYTIKVAASTRKGLGPHSEYVHGGMDASNLHYYTLLYILHTNFLNTKSHKYKTVT